MSTIISSGVHIPAELEQPNAEFTTLRELGDGNVSVNVQSDMTLEPGGRLTATVVLFFEPLAVLGTGETPPVRRQFAQNATGTIDLTPTANERTVNQTSLTAYAVTLYTTPRPALALSLESIAGNSRTATLRLGHDVHAGNVQYYMDSYVYMLAAQSSWTVEQQWWIRVQYVNGTRGSWVQVAVTHATPSSKTEQEVALPATWVSVEAVVTIVV